ncbi:MAG: helix-hairpin-helix domain-containing protein [Acetivibrionales bacterium]|jgi:competence protein ComEA
MTINIFGLKFTIRKYELVMLIVLLALILGLIGYKIMQANNGIIIDAGKNNEAEVSENHNEINGTQKELIESTQEIQVYVVGCVKNPGVVSLEKGQIINDAIKAAGGATEEADLENINLVYKLNSNVMIKILPKNFDSSTDEEGEAGKGIIITEDSGGALQDNHQKKVKVNLNTAGMEDLKSLPGIGEATAKEIILFREKMGEFKTIEDIMKVNGIKEGRFNTLKDYITVD